MSIQRFFKVSERDNPSKRSRLTEDESDSSESEVDDDLAIVHDAASSVSTSCSARESSGSSSKTVKQSKTFNRQCLKASL